MVLNYLFPAACVLCGELLPIGNSAGNNGEKKETFGMVCQACKKKLSPLKGPVCFRCGKAVEDASVEYCFDCEHTTFPFQRNRSVFDYTGPVRKAMHDFKYAHRRENATFFAEAVCHYLGAWILGLNADVIIPIPIHKRRKRHRGYNQAELLAQEVGKRLQIPVDESFLMRIENTKPQKELGRKERKINLENALKIHKNELQYYRVLLIDDIYTTGATLGGAASVLKASGVKEIYCVTACIGKGY